MHRSFLALAVATVLLLALSVPASAQTWIQLRYWHTDNTWNFGAPPTVSSSSGWGGISARRTLGSGIWALSFNYDQGSDTFPGGGGGQRNRIWNFNIHRNFTATNAMVSVYGGYGSAAYEAPNSPGNWYWRQQGPRVGFDAKYNLPDNWYLVGDLGYGFGTVDLNNIVAGGVVTGSANLLDWHAGVGRTFGMWGVEGGYRAFTWNVQPSAVTPTSTAWKGWYVGLNVTTP